METTTPNPNVKKCAYERCGKEFTPLKSNKKYCTDSCRARDSQRRQALNETGGNPTQVNAPGQTVFMSAPLFDKPAPKAEISAPRGLDFSTQYVFDSQKKEIDRWEKAYNEEREKRKKLSEEKQKIEKELSDLKTDQRISELSKPGGLAGFMENAFVKELAPHVAPVLAGIMARVLTPATPIVPTGGEVVNDETAAWVNAQSAEVQNSLRALIHEIAKQGESEKVMQAIERLRNILSKNQVFSNSTVGNGPVRGSGTFGM